MRPARRPALRADHTVVLYGCEALEPVRVLGGHSAPVRSLRWDVELDLCYAACHDGTPGPALPPLPRQRVWHIPMGGQAV